MKCKIKYILIILLIAWFLASSLISDDFENYKQTEESKFEGNRIFNEMIMAFGDVNQIQTIRTAGITIQPIPQGSLSFPVEVSVVFPDKFKVKFQDKEFIIDKDKGWMKYLQGYYENLPESYVKTILGNLERNLIRIAKNKEEYEILFLGEEHVLNKDCKKLLLKKDEAEIILLIDMEKHLPLQMLYENISAKTLLKRIYLEYKSFDGIMYPVHTISYDENAQKISEIIIKEVEINLDIDEEDF